MKVFMYIGKHIREGILFHDYVTQLRKNLPDSCELLPDGADIADADIIHIIACWEHRAARLACKARKMRIPYVISTMGGLNQWTLHHPQIKHSLQCMRYQRSMMRYAGAVITTTEPEKNFIANLKWTSVIFRIPNSLLNSSETAESMSQKIAQVYDNVFEKASEKMKFYADDSIKGEGPEQDVARLIKLINMRMPHRNIPKDMTASLATMLHDTDYSDDDLADILKKTHLYKYSASLFAVMQKMNGLTEGFMPMPPSDDKTTKKIEGYIK